MNWGNKLLVAFIVFGTGIFYLVFRSMNTNFELVEKEYYNSELHYQNVIDGVNRAHALHSSPALEQKGGVIFLQLPGEMRNKKITGDILFYCAYNEKKDKKFILDIREEGTQAFTQGAVTPGNYTVKINWMAEGENYYAEKKLTVL